MAFEYFIGSNGYNLSKTFTDEIYILTKNFRRTLYDVEGIYASYDGYKQWKDGTSRIYFLGDYLHNDTDQSERVLGKIVEVRTVNGVNVAKIDTQIVPYPQLESQTFFQKKYNAIRSKNSTIWSSYIYVPLGSSVMCCPTKDYVFYGGDNVPYALSRNDWKTKTFYLSPYNEASNIITLYNYNGSKIELTPKTNEDLVFFRQKISKNLLGRFVRQQGDFYLFKLENPDLLNYMYKVFPNKELIRDIERTRETLELKIAKSDNSWKLCRLDAPRIFEALPTVRAEDFNAKVEEINNATKDDYEQDASAEDKGNQMLEVVAKGYKPVAVVKFEKTDLYFKNDEIIGTFDTKKLAETRGSHKVIGYTDPTIYFSNEVKVPLYLSEISLDELKKELGASKRTRLENENNVVWVKIKDVAWYGADVNLNGEWIIHTELPENLPFKEEVEVAPTDAPAENRKENEQKDNKLLWLAIAAGALILMK